MNPYLEMREFWPEVHHLLISILAETLNPQVLPKYRVAIEKRVYQMNGDDAPSTCAIQLKQLAFFPESPYRSSSRGKLSGATLT